MVADILAIPVTTVASESAFSVGGRVIDPHRSCLGTKTVDMLICGADWYRHYYGLKKKRK
ncbi:putative HAT dimerization domain, ribonuclease H-like superfamily [Helianthus anomalus]